MKINKIILIIGISLILIATGLSYTYEIIEISNTSPALLDFVEIQPQEKIVEKITLKGENEVGVTLGVREEGTPIKVIVSNENGQIVKELIPEKRIHIFTFENPFPRGQFIVSTTNLGDEATDVYLHIRDVKEPGTYIDTFDAYWAIIPTALILGVIGAMVLIIGGMMSLISKIMEKRKTPKTHDS